MAIPSKTPKTILQRVGLFFYDHVKTTGSLWIALVIFGILSYGVFMQRQGFPNVAVPIGMSNGTYFVNDKAKVDSDIVKPLSQLILKQDNVKTVTSNAGANFYNVIIEYKDGTNTPQTIENLKLVVQQAGFMPPKATIEYKAFNASKFNNEYDVLLSVRKNGNTSITELAAIADQAVKGLTGTKGVSKVTVLEQFKNGINPATGQNISLQQSFDRVGERRGDKIVFYPSIEIGVIAKAGTDAVHLEKALNERINSLQSQPSLKDAHIAVSAGVAESINTQIDGLQQNLLEGLVIVILISLLLISWRAGLAAALSMTTVLLITIGVLYAVGITLNTITLFALVLCLGLIVDDTTIMAEAIDAGKRAQATNREIVSRAIKKVARASFAGTLVTMMAFAPMLFIGGILGSFIRVLPITIITSLAVSLLVSLTLIPFMSRRLLLSDKSKKARGRNPIVRIENSISGGLARLIRVGNRNRKKASIIGLSAIFLSLIFLGASTVFFQKLKFDIFPSNKDSDELLLNIIYPSGTSIESAQDIAAKTDTILARSLGDNLQSLAYLDSGSTQNASARVRLISFRTRTVKSPELVAAANAALKNFTEARVKISQLDAGPPKDDLPFRVQIYGEDTAKTAKLAGDIASYIQNRAVTRASNQTNAVINRVVIMGNGDYIGRKNSQRQIEVQAGFDSDDISALVTAAQKTVEAEFTPTRIASYGLSKADVTFDFGNESNNQDSFKSMLFAFPVLLLLMYLLLAFQFRSLLQPLLIFTAIPFSFFGVAAGLHYTNNPLSFFVMIGFFALIGIAVNNTILLTDFANQARKDGHGGFESMALAVKARFRPLLTTSLTSVVALIPLALSDPFWEALAFTLIFGLLSSTLLVIVAFPYYFLAIEYLRSKFSRKAALLWLALLVVVIIGLGRVKASLIPLGLAVYAAALIAIWFQRFYVRRLAR